MADKVPTVGTLDKPENLEELLKQDRGEDCMPCRVVGEYLNISPTSLTIPMLALIYIVPS